MDKANFAFTLNGKRYVMENTVLIADGAISDPEYCEYELAIFVAELLEEKTKLKEEIGKLKESNEAYRQEVKELRCGP
jgi:cell division protein FtsB